MKKIISILAPAFALLVASCEKEDIRTADTNQVVVEAFMHTGDTVKLKITRQFVYDTDATSFEPVSGLDISISDGTANYALQSTGNGNYTSTLVAQSGKSYTLSFDYFGKKVLASCIAPTAPVNLKTSAPSIRYNPMLSTDTFRFVTVRWQNAESDYYFATVSCQESNPTPVMTGFYSATSTTIEPVKTDSFRLPDRMFRYYGKHRVVLYHVNAEYAALYRKYSSNAESLTNPPTNITNGLGIFTAFATDTVWINVIKRTS